MNTLRILLLAGVAFIFALSSLVYADVPQMINYQGRLTTPQGALVDTTVPMTFIIYADSLGMLPSLWGETQDSIKVEEGIFNVLLGDINPIPDSVFDGSVRYLGIKVGGDPEMRPLMPIVSVAYAYTDGDWAVEGDTLYRLSGNVGIGEIPPDDVKLYVKTEPSFWMYGVYAEAGMGVKGVSNALAGTGISGEGGHAGIAGYGGYIGVLGQGFYGGFFDGQGHFSGNLGIGITDPENKLHVTGAINLDPIGEPAAPSTGFVIYVDTSDGKLKAKSYDGNVTVLADP